MRNNTKSLVITWTDDEDVCEREINKHWTVESIKRYTNNEWMQISTTFLIIARFIVALFLWVWPCHLLHLCRRTRFKRSILESNTEKFWFGHQRFPTVPIAFISYRYFRRAISNDHIRFGESGGSILLRSIFVKVLIRIDCRWGHTHTKKMYKINKLMDKQIFEMLLI